MGARDIILRRRAALVAATLGTLTPAASSAEEVDKPSLDEAIEVARHLESEGNLTKALAMLNLVDSPSVEVLMFRGRLAMQLQRYPAAREDYEVAARLVEDAQTRRVLERALDDVRARTAKLTVVVTPNYDTEIRVDGVLMGVAPLDEPLYVSPGKHLITAFHEGHTPATKTVEVAGGAEIEVNLPVVAPVPCLSMIAPTPHHTEGVTFGGGIGPHFLAPVSHPGAPLVGAEVDAFIHVGMRPFSFRAGPTLGVFGTARGASATGALHFEARAHVGGFISIGLGAMGGYFHISDEPEPSAIEEGNPGPFTTRSFFVAPTFGFTALIGPVEVGPRMSLMMSRSELGATGNFGPTYLNAGFALSYTVPTAGSD